MPDFQQAFEALRGESCWVKTKGQHRPTQTCNNFNQKLLPEGKKGTYRRRKV
jgi:hypothetical protein